MYGTRSTACSIVSNKQINKGGDDHIFVIYTASPMVRYTLKMKCAKGCHEKSCYQGEAGNCFRAHHELTFNFDMDMLKNSSLLFDENVEKVLLGEMGTSVLSAPVKC